jgi:hypothetical protein
MALLLGAALSFGCGGDDGGGSDDDDDNQGESGQGGDDGESGSGGGPIGGEGIPCGTTRCETPENATGEACCYDNFASKCGMRGGIGNSACVEIVETDTRCPNVMLGGQITLASCCTADNQCGITPPPPFGNGQCTELSVAEQMAMDRASMFDEGEDGGLDFPGDGGGGFMFDFPDPQPCE